MGRLNKQIKELANKLPKTYREASKIEFEEIFNARSREIKNNVLEGQGFEIVNDAPEYVAKKGVTFIEVNHEKRIRKAFNQNGNKGVEDYIRWVNDNNIMLNKKYKMKFEMDIIKKLLNTKIQPLFK